MADRAIRVTVWNEFVHETTSEAVGKVYPDGIHAVLAATDVLTWWGHAAHDRVADAVVDRVQRRVLEGMGLVVLHSAHASCRAIRSIGVITGRPRVAACRGVATAICGLAPAAKRWRRSAAGDLACPARHPVTSSRRHRNGRRRRRLPQSRRRRRRLPQDKKRVGTIYR